MGTTTIATIAPEQVKPEEKPLRADARRNRERIIEVARVAFMEEGADVQMEAIAKRAGVGVGTLYRNFPTKDALFGEVIRDQLRMQLNDMERALEQEDTPLELREMVFRWAQAAEHHLGIRDMIAEFPGAKHCPGENDRYNTLMASFLARASDEGQIRSGITVEDFRALLCGLFGAISSGGHWKRCAEVILDGLRPVT